MKKTLVLILLTFAVANIALAQKAKFGIKAGLNVPTMLNSEAEKDASGKALDKMEVSPGFQVGMTAQLPLTDVFGLQGEILYTTRGAVYKYDGPGSLNIKLQNSTTGDIYNVTGNMRYLVRYSNGYLEVPLLAYYKPNKSFKIELGISPMFLIGSTGQGEALLTKGVFGTTSLRGKDTTISVAINADYLGYNDKNQQYDQPPTSTNVQTNEQIISAQGDNYVLPARVGAYYFNTNRSGGNTFRTFDLGANLGFSYFFTTGLYLSLRANYGLLDIIPQEQDVYISKNTGTSKTVGGNLGVSTDFQPIQRPNFTRNFNVGLTVGFSF